MLRSRRDKVLHDGRVVDLSAACCARRRSQGRHAKSGSRRTRHHGGALRAWAKLAPLAIVALVVIAGREGALTGPDWLAGPLERPPIRAAMNVRPQRADCNIARVVDGDTVDLACPGEGVVRARLLGFDTPEVFSPGCASEHALGNAATRALHRRISSSGEMRVDFRGSDHYGRRLARLALDGRDVAQPMIAEGLARPYHGGRRRSWCG